MENGAELATDAGDTDLATALLAEAQQEVASLRSELYNTRRREWEAREELTKVSHERDDSQQALAELQLKVTALQAAAVRAAQLKDQCQELERNKSVVEFEVQELRQKLSDCQRNLAAEQACRRKAEELRARAESERNRLQRERDEAQSQLRIVSRRAEEAEEEQCRAEEEAAQARAELSAYASRAQQDGAFSGQGGGGREEQMLRLELENERSRVAMLTTALDDAKAKVAAQQEQLSKAHNHNSLLQSGMEEQHSQRKLRDEEVRRREAAVAQARDSEQQASAAKQQLAPRAPADAETRGDGELQERLAQQELMVTRLKLTREKLLLEMDDLSSTVERLFAENEALSDALFQQRAISNKWELQAQEGIARAEQLKTMLEESARWGGEDAGKRLEADLLAERAKCAGLDLQVRTLAAEITKASQHTSELGRSFLPVLTAIETRMAELLHRPAKLADAPL